MKKLTKLLIFGAIVCLCGNDEQPTYARTKDGKAQSYYEIAQDMVDGINERKTEFKIYYTGFSPDEINDNENIIFDYANGLDGYAMHSYSSLDTVEYNQKKGEYIIKPKYQYTNKQRQELLTFVKNEMSKIISDDMDNMKKVEAIRLWLNDYLVYDDSQNNDNDYEAMIYKSGNCTGYSMLFETACEVAGVPCRTISGLLGKIPHAWNSVYVD